MAEQTEEQKVPKKKETVTVDKEALESLLSRVKTLEAVADKSRVAWYEAQNPNQKKQTHVTLGTYPTDKGSKIIVGWSNMPLNEMYQDTNGNWHERQQMKLVFADDSTLDVTYIDFVRRKKSIKALVTKKSTDETTGAVTFDVETLDAPVKKLSIDATFINI